MLQLNFEIVGKPNKVILIYSPCRSGSSALLNSFAMADIQAIYQPIKGAVRRLMTGNSEPVIINVRTSTLVIKETLGPYFPEQVSFDPIAVILSKGIDPSGLHVIALFRRPEECLFSWMRNFRTHDIDLSLFGASYETVYNDCVQARKMSVHVVPLRYEDMADSKALPGLLAELEIPFDPAMQNWTLSKKFHAGKFAYQDIPCPNMDDEQSGDSLASTDSFVVRPPAIGIQYIPDSMTANAARLELARAIYTTRIEDLAVDTVLHSARFNAHAVA